MPDQRPRYKTVLFHLVTWVILSVLQSLTVFSHGDTSFLRKLVTELIWVIPNLPFAYCIAYIFIPRFLLRNRIGVFLLATSIWNLCWMPLNSWFFIYAIKPYQYGEAAVPAWTNSLFNPSQLIPMSIPACVFSVISLVGHYVRVKEKEVQIERERLSFELQLLRSQLQPHFLLETLDGLQTRLLDSWEEASRIVISLSHLLRYTLYECEAEEVSLGKDLEALVHYIRLESFRYGHKIDVSLSITGEAREMRTTPMLLFPMVEEAFQQVDSLRTRVGEGDGDAGQAWISLDIRIEGEVLKVKLINSLVHTVGEGAIIMRTLPLSGNKNKTTQSYGTAMPVGG